MEASNSNGKCKICGSSSLVRFVHTAKCEECGILLYYPYPKHDIDLVHSGEGKPWSKHNVLNWYLRSSFYNHDNFGNMIKFAVDQSSKGRELVILDYGGGGGQFAFVFKSLFPQSEIYITDINDDALLDKWRCCNNQIPFSSFNSDGRKFDFIFMCDVFEHVSDPKFTLFQLADKLKEGGRIFIDTPKQFWIYPLTRFISKKLYSKVLRGTVSTAHLQIWSMKAFRMVIKESGLVVLKYSEVSEYTMPADYYLNNMHINNYVMKLMGRIFYNTSNVLAKNKIMCVLSKSI